MDRADFFAISFLLWSQPSPADSYRLFLFLSMLIGPVIFWQAENNSVKFSWWINISFLKTRRSNCFAWLIGLKLQNYIFSTLQILYLSAVDGDKGDSVQKKKELWKHLKIYWLYKRKGFVLTWLSFSFAFNLSNALTEVSSKCPFTPSLKSGGLGRIASPQFISASVCSLLRA